MFQKGNKLWAKGLETKAANQAKVDAFLLTCAGSGMDKYTEIMDRLADGEELTKAEIQYLDRVDSWRPWVRPKLSSVEQNTKVNLKIEKIEQLESSLRTIAGMGNTGGGSDEDEGVGKESVQG